MFNYTIENISHACLRYKADGLTILTDPWIVDEPIKSNIIYKFPPQVEDVEKVVENVDYVYISHTHEDHLHVPSLRHLPKHTKFLISDFSFAPFQGDRNLVLLETLKGLGFEHIEVLQPWTWRKLSDAVEVCLIPSAPTREMDWENTGLAIKCGGHVSLNMNDNVADESLCREIKKFFGTVGIYFVQTAGLSTYPACFDMSDDERADALNSKTINFSLHNRIVDIVEPEYLIPYAGDFGWFGEKTELTFNSRQTPLPLLNHLNAKEGVNTTLFEPSDILLIESGKISPQRNSNIDWSDLRKLHRSCEKKYQKYSDYYDNRYKDVRLKDYLSDVNRYFQDLALWHNQGGPITNFSEKIVYRINDTNDEVLWEVSANEGAPLTITKVKQIPEGIAQIHTLRFQDFLPVLTGEYMLSEIQWRTKITQNYKSKNSVLLLFFINYYVDKGNRTPQVILTPTYRIDNVG